MLTEKCSLSNENDSNIGFCLHRHDPVTTLAELHLCVAAGMWKEMEMCSQRSLNMILNIEHRTVIHI